MRKPIIAGNWKMNLLLEEAVSLAKAVREKTKECRDREILFFPPSPFLQAVVRAVEGSPIGVGSQNIYFEEKGAFTGEISGPMIKSIGCTHVLVGHSERRHIFGEEDGLLNRKLKAALKFELTGVFCVGETLEEREGGRTSKVIQIQISKGLEGIGKEEMKKVLIAYEPVWAIGTGRTAKPEQADEAHGEIREMLKELYGKDVANWVGILYGGSVTPDNIRGLMEKPEVDGVLVGGASLKAESFVKLIKFQ